MPIVARPHLDDHLALGVRAGAARPPTARISPRGRAGRALRQLSRRGAAASYFASCAAARGPPAARGRGDRFFRASSRRSAPRRAGRPEVGLAQRQQPAPGCPAPPCAPPSRAGIASSVSPQSDQRRPPDRVVGHPGSSCCAPGWCGTSWRPPCSSSPPGRPGPGCAPEISGVGFVGSLKAVRSSFLPSARLPARMRARAQVVAHVHVVGVDLEGLAEGGDRVVELG